MSDYEFNIPENYEEAYQLKQELLEKINAYNQALFNGEELPYSDEEIDRFQEEYQILNDHLALSDEEKLLKLEENEKVVNADGTIEAKTTVWDKIHWSIYLYGFVSTIFICGILTEPIGNASMNKFMTNYFEKAYNEGVGMYALAKSEMMMSGFGFYLKLFISYLWFPLIIIALSVAMYLLFHKHNDINAKITKWLLIVHIGLTVVSIVLIMVFGEFSFWKEFFDNLSNQYANYYYNIEYYGGY